MTALTHNHGDQFGAQFWEQDSSLPGHKVDLGHPLPEQLPWGKSCEVKASALSPPDPPEELRMEAVFCEGLIPTGVHYVDSIDKNTQEFGCQKSSWGLVLRAPHVSCTGTLQQTLFLCPTSQQISTFWKGPCILRRAQVNRNFGWFQLRYCCEYCSSAGNFGLSSLLDKRSPGKSMPTSQLWCVSRNTTLWEKVCLVMGYNSATKPSCPIVAVWHNAHSGWPPWAG